MQPFVFASDAASLKGESTRLLEIQANLPNKNTLFSWYAGALELPDYFGANWDAFEECLRNLSWISERRVVLYHPTIPLEASPTDRKTYIEVLACAVQDWKPEESHELVVAFDPAHETELRAIASFLR